MYEIADTVIALFLARYCFSRKLGLFVRKVFPVYDEGLGAARFMGSDGDTKGHGPQTPH
jgi:hypothetical protein